MILVPYEDAAEARLTSVAKPVADEAASTLATTALMRSPKGLASRQKTDTYSGAIVRSSIVLAANRANNQRTRKTHCRDSLCLPSRREASPSRPHRQRCAAESHQLKGGTRSGSRRIRRPKTGREILERPASPASPSTRPQAVGS